MAFSTSLSLNPNQPKILYVRGLAAREDYDPPASLADFEAAIKGAPHLAHPYWRAAWLAMEMGALEHARSLADAALNVDPTNRNARRVSARYYLDSDTPEKGVAELESLVQSNPTDQHVLWLYARLLRAAGRDTEAARYAKLGGTKTPVYTDPWASWVMARRTGKAAERKRVLGFAGKGKFAAAEQLLARLQSQFPGDREISLLEGRLMVARGDTESARSQFQSLVAVHPDWALPHHELGMVLMRPAPGGVRPNREMMSRARFHLEKAVGLRPESTTARAWLAQLQGMAKQWPEAIENFQICVDEAPLNVQYRNSLAAVQMPGGKPAESLATLDQARRLFHQAEPPPVLATRVRANIALGNLIEAATALDQLRREAPQHRAIRPLAAALQKAAGS